MQPKVIWRFVLHRWVYFVSIYIFMAYILKSVSGSVLVFLEVLSSFVSRSSFLNTKMLTLRRLKKKNNQLCTIGLIDSWLTDGQTNRLSDPYGFSLTNYKHFNVKLFYFAVDFPLAGGKAASKREWWVSMPTTAESLFISPHMYVYVCCVHVCI